VGVFEGRVGLKLELEGTRVCCGAAILGTDDWCLRGEVGRDGGRGLYVEVALLNGGLGFWGLVDGGTRPMVLACYQISGITLERKRGDRHTVLGVLFAGGSSRDRCAVPGPVDEPATFLGESNCVRAKK